MNGSIQTIRSPSINADSLNPRRPAGQDFSSSHCYHDFMTVPVFLLLFFSRSEKYSPEGRL
jgi:hypothetical protein